MEYKFPNLKYEISSLNENEIMVIVKDGEGYINPSMGSDEYYQTIYFDEFFQEYPKGDIKDKEDDIKYFMKYFDRKLRNMLPDWEDFNTYNKVEGYWECMGLVKAHMESIWNDLDFE